VGLAYRASLEGRQDDAIADYSAASIIFRDLDDKPAAVWTLNGLGTALQERGRFREAATCYDQVAELAKQIGYTEVEALAYNNRGSLEFAMGDLGLAMEHFQIAARLQRELKQNQEAVVSGTNVALSLTYMGRLDEAAVLLQDLVRECKENNWAERELYVLRSLADVRRLQGRRHEAMTLMRHALAREDIDPGIRTRSECVISLSATLAEMDSSAAALEVLQNEEGRQKGELQGAVLIEFELALGDRLLETGQPEAAREKFRFAIGATDEMGVQLYKVVALAMAARCLRDLGLPEEALARLREAARAWEDIRTTPLNPEWREQFGATGRLVYAQLAALILGGGEPGAGAIREAFDSVQIFKARTLAERIHGGDSTAGRPALTLEKLQTEVLAEGELFLDAYLGPVESILFAVTRDQCRAILLQDEKTMADRWRLQYELLATPPEPGDQSRALAVASGAGARLGLELWGSAAALLAESRRVVYAPDGALNLVPLVALTRYDGPERQLEWMRVPSATIFGFLRSERETARAPGQGTLAVAAVETPDGQPLKGAVREVKHLARRYRNVDTWLGADSGAAPAPADMAGFNILHLAAHARVDDQRPWYSEIVLDANDPAARLRADSIAELDLSARLAVLSACETGSGRILSGEGVLGLSSAFLGAGVPAVLASLWPVEDQVTAILMERFYEELSLGRAPATALSQAQDAIRSDPATAHPFHWAGFVVIGDGTAMVDLEAKRRPGPVTGYSVAGAMIIALALVVRRRFRAPKK